jgi:hypothetical protein
MPPVLLGAFPGSDAFSEPQAVAVDEITGDVYVLDVGNAEGPARIERFDAEGAPAAFAGSQPYIRGNELTGTPTGGFAFDQNSAAGIAIDTSSGPFHGDIYVTDSLHGVVDIFASDGTLIGSLNGAGTPQSAFGEPCGVAIDQSGDVYIGDFGGFVERYIPVSPSPPISDAAYTVSEISGVAEPCGLAADAAGNIFASQWPVGPLNEFDHSQFPASGASPGTPSLVDASSLAVSAGEAADELYVDEGTQMAQLEASGGASVLIASFGVLSGHSYGVAVNSAMKRIYVSDQGAAGGPTLQIYGPPTPAPPTVVSESTTGVTDDSANLTAEINPNFTDTKYYFEYGASTTYESTTPNSPIELGEGGGAGGVQTVLVHVQGLQPDVTYHYRVEALSTRGLVTGRGLTFTTEGSHEMTSLPDGRSWEMVSPLDKNSSIITGIDGFPGPAQGGVIEAAPNGEEITYASSGAFDAPQGAPGASQYMAVRGADSWLTQNITPPLVSLTYPVAGAGGPYQAFSEDLSSGLVWSGNTPDRSPPLSEGAPSGYQNYYLHGNLTGGYQAVLTSIPNEPASRFNMGFEGATPDLRTVVFYSFAALTPDAIEENENRNLYEWSGGQTQLVNLLPGATHGQPGATIGYDAAGESAGERPISSDGSRVFFTDEENLYVREDGLRTVELDTGQNGLESGGGEFWAASSNGTKVLFTDTRKLTHDATAGGGSDLYSRDLTRGTLTDLTTGDPGGAEVLGVLGTSDDGSYLYFVANGVLAPGGKIGHCFTLIEGGGPQRCNLYLWHEGTTRFIASLSQDDNLSIVKDRRETLGAANDWEPRLAFRTTRISPDGQRLVFMSNSSLTGYDNRNAQTGVREQEVYLYNAGVGALSCVSCSATGARPTGSASIPAATQYATTRGVYESRVLSDTGRVFFDTTDGLVPSDTNGREDVYEWEEDGVGGCERAAGCLSLISSGTDGDDSAFVDASANGDNVFFITRAQLVSGDTDQLTDLYDARIGDGLPSPPAATPPCLGEECKPAILAAPVLGPPTSLTFSGVGNSVVVTKKKPAVKAKTKKKPAAKHKKQVKKKRKHSPKPAHPQSERARVRKGKR